MSHNFIEVKPEDGAVWPAGRSGHRMCADENFLYVFGGYDPALDHKLYNELWCYNITTGCWKLLPDEENTAPIECASSSLVLAGSNLLVFGGSGYPFAHSNSDKMMCYNLRTLTWLDLSKIGREKLEEKLKAAKPVDEKECKDGEEKLEDLKKQQTDDKRQEHPACSECHILRDEGPEPKYGQSMALSPDGQLVIYSGTTGRDFDDDTHLFDLTNLSWSQLIYCPEHAQSNKPHPRYRHEVVWDNDRFILIGGSIITGSFLLREVHSFCFKDLSWSSHQCSLGKSDCEDKVFDPDSTVVKYLPGPRKAHSCILWRDNVYVMGGILHGPFSDSCYSDLWRLNLKTFTWHRCFTDFPHEIYFHSAAISPQGCMYVFGGVRGTETTVRNADLFKIWLDVPSLSELAWMKLTDTLKESNKLNETELRKLNLPKKFLRRVTQYHNVAG